MQTIEEKTDVLVVGGGTAGVIAALQAARAGAATVLLEASGVLGGTMTLGGIPAPGYFYAGARQVIAGIGWDLVSTAIALDGTTVPDLAGYRGDRPSRHVPVNPHAYALVAEDACVSAGVRLRFHETAVDVRPGGEQWNVRAIGKGVERLVTARELVDCTGDADLVGMLGYGRMRSGERQPGTLAFALEGYDPDTLDADQVERLYVEALRQGHVQHGDWWLSDRSFIGFLRARGSNAQHVPGADSTTSGTQSQANLAGRASLLRLLRFVKTIPGCEGVRVRWMAPYTAVRETCRIAGETVISADDYRTGRVFDDAIGYSYYFIDVHRNTGVEHEFLGEGVVPTIPLGALIPRGSSRILVAGRSISSDPLAFSALRVQASCMVMGQAAGAAAALGALQGVPSHTVPIGEVRDILARHGAILPPSEDQTDAER